MSLALPGPTIASLNAMPRRTQKGKRTRALVNWEETPPQIHVLDWRRRATDWGLVPVGSQQPDGGGEEDRDDAAEAEPFSPDPERLLTEEEPEAEAWQPVTADAEEEGEQDVQPDAVADREAANEPR